MFRIAALCVVAAITTATGQEPVQYKNSNRARPIPEVQEPTPESSQDKLVQAYEETKKEVELSAQKIVESASQITEAKLEDRIESLVDQIEKDPENWHLHTELCKSLIQRIDQLVEVNRSAMKTNLIEKRDRIVKILEELAINLEQKSDLSAQKAQLASDSLKGAYHGIGESAGRFSRAYRTKAEEFRSISLESNINELQQNIEWLEHTKGLLLDILPALDSILADKDLLEQFQQMSVNLDEIQMAIERFSRAINEGFLLRKSKNEKSSS